MSAPIASKLVTTPLTADSVLVLEAVTTDRIAPIVLTPGEWSFGSGSRCRVVLPESDADEVHAQVSVSEKEVVVCAWGRGVQVNGAEVDDAILAIGDRLAIGATAFLVRRAHADEISEPTRKVQTQSAEAAGAPSSETLFRRIGVIAETLDSLERELRGEEQACDRLDQVIERIQNHLANGVKSTPSLSVFSRRDESLRTIREQLDGLVSALHTEMQTPPEPKSSARTLSAERSHLERLDEVIARVQPAENVADDWASQQTAVATRMTTHLSRLLVFSQRLCARAAVLDDEAVDLNAQWDDLRQQREELSLQRELLHEEAEHFNQRVEVWPGIDAKRPHPESVAATSLTVGNAAQTNELGDVLPDGSEGNRGGQRVGHSRDTFASANWNLDGEFMDDWSVTTAGKPVASSAVDVERHTPAFDGREHDEEFADRETNSGIDSYEASEGLVPRLGLEPLVESLENEELVESFDSATDSGVLIATTDEPNAGEETRVESHFDTRAASQVGELQRLVQEIELDAEGDGNDDTIDELPVGSLVPSTWEHESVNAVSATTSRDAAVAELDALLAAYAHEEESKPVEPAMDIKFDDSLEAASDESVLEVADSAAEGTLDLSSGETWYEGQSLEVANEFRPESVELSTADASDEMSSPAVESLRHLEDQAARAAQLIDALGHEELPLDVIHVESLEEVAASATTEPVHGDDAIEIDDSARLDTEMFAPSFSVDIDDDVPDSDTQRHELFQSQPESVAELPSGSLLAQLERKSAENAEEAKLNDLRSQLADLFGMKPNAAVRREFSDEKPLDERFESFFTGGKSVEELDQQGTLTEVNNSLSTEIEPVDDAVEPTVSNVPDEASKVEVPTHNESEDADDSIRAYMAQLIARNKQVAQGHASDESVDTRQEGTSTVEGYSTLAFEALPEKKSSELDYSYLSEEPKHKQDKDAVRASMTQLRQLANMQARTAVVRAGRKQLKLQVLAKLAGTVMSFAFGVTAIMLHLPAVYGYVVCGLGLLFACDLCLSIVRNWRLLAKQGKLVRESNDAEQSELKVDPRTEGRLDQFTKASRQ